MGSLDSLILLEATRRATVRSTFLLLSLALLIVVLADGYLYSQSFSADMFATVFKENPMDQAKGLQCASPSPQVEVETDGSGARRSREDPPARRQPVRLLLAPICERR